MRAGPFGVDEAEGPSKTSAMTKEQLQSFAEAVRTGRAKLNLNKTEFCAKVGIVPNTLRALEKASQDPSQDTIDKLARVLGMTPHALTSGKRVVEAGDPLLADLNDEDLEIAQAFHHVPMRVKQKILGVLQERRPRTKEVPTADVARWAKRLLALAPEQRAAVATVITEFEEMGSEAHSQLPPGKEKAR